jgi:prepilin-type N-terminal cleavage/methylation domain-containing protein
MYKFNAKGFTFIEVMVSMAIILILIGGGVSVVFRTRNMNTVRAGISRVFQLKNAVDTMAKECGGYPTRSATDDYEHLQVIVNRCGDGAPNCTTYPNGLPEIYPTGRECDAVSLQNSISENLQASTCYVDEPGCAGKIRRNNTKAFNALFVEDGKGIISGNCSSMSGSKSSGWNYTLANPDTDNPSTRPIAVVCANVLYNPGRTNGSVTVVLNSAGVTKTGFKAYTDSGMIAPDGAELPNACPCGAWCANNVTGASGCCGMCTDANTGITHAGIGFRYR